MFGQNRDDTRDRPEPMRDATSRDDRAGSRSRGFIMARICTVSKREFRENAQTAFVDLLGGKVAIGPKMFATGSFGWHGGGKLPVRLENGQIVECQVGLNVTVIGSKDAPAGE